MVALTEKQRESKARYEAKKHGYVLKKSRMRNGKINIDNFGGYMIVDARTNFIISGERFDLSLDEVEHILFY